MELIAADKDTVTIKMNRKEEFSTILAIFMSAYQEYDQLDQEIHNRTEEEIHKIEQALWEISKKLPYKK
ncbi:MAG: hypothetical protein IPP67_04640 [Rhodospirillaceae bacterium]|nr:hypothetical protein [Rhodospirillaceae bacterium]